MTSAVKRAFLFSCLAADTYGLLQNLLGYDNVIEKLFDVLVQKLSTHFRLSTHFQAGRCFSQLQNATWRIVLRVGSFVEEVSKRFAF